MPNSLISLIPWYYITRMTCSVLWAVGLGKRKVQLSLQVHRLCVELLKKKPTNLGIIVLDVTVLILGEVSFQQPEFIS